MYFLLLGWNKQYLCQEPLKYLSFLQKTFFYYRSVTFKSKVKLNLHWRDRLHWLYGVQYTKADIYIYNTPGGQFIRPNFEERAN